MKQRIKKFMRIKNTCISPEDIPRFLYKEITLNESKNILDDMFREDEEISRLETKDGLLVYYIKFKE